MPVAEGVREPGVGVVSPAVGHAAAAIGGGDGATIEAPILEVAGKEDPSPAEGVPGLALGEDGKGAAPMEGVPAAIAVQGETGEEKEAAAEEKEKEEEEEAEAEENEDEEEEGVKWLKHYSSMQSILIVGDGDLSFSLALATAFDSGANLVATSLDTYAALKGKYNKAESNIMELKRLGTTVLHGVDVKTMKLHTDLKNRRFDRIVYNFPHAGFKGKEDQVHMINLHKDLVRAFFRNAFHLLRPSGQIHISHKTGRAYDRWDLEQLASESSLIMVDRVDFRKADYPGYNQKGGDGPKCDQPFDLGTCCTFMFQIGDLKCLKKLSRSRAGSIPSAGSSNTHLVIPASDTTPFHRLPPADPCPQQHLPPPVNTVHMPMTVPPHVHQMQQPGFPPNFNVIVGAPWFHQQHTAHPMLSIPGPSLSALANPACFLPLITSIACSNLVARQVHPWYQQRTFADPLGRTGVSYLAWEYQRSLQREYEVQRQVTPGGTSLNYSAFLEQRHRESVQRQEWLNSMIAHGRQ